MGSKPDLGKRPAVKGSLPMRKLVFAAIALAIVAASYAGSAIAGLNGLIEAVRARDADAVVSHVDLERVRKSLVAQIVAAYLDRIGQDKRVNTRDQWIAGTVGGTVADAMLAKVLMPENIVRVLHDGHLPASEERPEIQVPRLSDLNVRNIAETVSRVRLVNSGEFAVRLSHADSEFYGIRMRFAGTGWRLATIELPQSVLRQIVDKLPKPTA